MRGKIAKLLRLTVYGSEFSPRVREYTPIEGQVVSDKRRRDYQYLKRVYTLMTKNQKNQNPLRKVKA